MNAAASAQRSLTDFVLNCHESYVKITQNTCDKVIAVGYRVI